MLAYLRPERLPSLMPGEYLATPHQERIFFTEKFEKGTVYPNSPTYHNLPFLRGLPAVPDRERLRYAAAAVFGRHEALRTPFSQSEGILVHRIEPVPCADPPWL